MKESNIYVTSPLLPPLEEFIPYLEQIWESKWITNNGTFHQQLENALCEYLGVKHLSLFTNGTLPIITALQALKITGEVITTPYSFVATSHALIWNGIKPVFVDIDPNSFNIDPEKIENSITPLTTAIMPVHVYGNPCDIEAIQSIANKHNLKVIYDAAHAFGVEVMGRSILKYGDISTLSFHATKVFNTIEGGALICRDKETKQKIDNLKNFGFIGETEVVDIGINGKMDELRSAFGILNLKNVDESILKRKMITEKYLQEFKNIDGISCNCYKSNVKYNYSYFPILVDEDIFGITRDDLYEKLKLENIFARRYFYPLISNFSIYCNLESAKISNLPVANLIANRIICLPLHQDLSFDQVNFIIDIIKKNKK